MSTFSILVPTYNHEQFIDDCIRSVVAQTFTDWEMIVLDDGSPDGTGALVREWAKSELRITYIRQSNKGIFRLFETNNYGLGISKGKYICILEGDDYWEKDKLQKQFNALESHPEVVLCWGKVNAFSSETKKIHTILPMVGSTVPFSWNNNPSGNILNNLCLDNFIPSVTITMRRTALEEIGGFQELQGFPATDLPTVLKLATMGPFYFCNEILANYRIQSNQITKVYSIKLLEQRIQFIHGFIASLPPVIKQQLMLTTPQLDRHFRKTRLITRVVSGRHKLIRQEYKEARKDFLAALETRSALLPAWRLAAFAGLVFGLFHRNMEGLLQVLGKTGYR